MITGYSTKLVELYTELGFSYDDIREMEADFLESEEQFLDWIDECPNS